MKRLLLIFALLTTTPGCAAFASLGEAIRRDPAAAFAHLVRGINTAVTASNAAFGLWKAMNPGTVSDEASAQFNSIVSSISRGVRVAEATADTITATNAEARVAAATDGVQRLHEFLRGLQGNGTGGAATPEMQEALAATAAVATRR